MCELNKKKKIRVRCWLKKWEVKRFFGVVLLAWRLPCRERGFKLARKKQGFAINQKATEGKKWVGRQKNVKSINALKGNRWYMCSPWLSGWSVYVSISLQHGREWGSGEGIFRDVLVYVLFLKEVMTDGLLLQHSLSPFPSLFSQVPTPAAACCTICSCKVPKIH